jgi:hypothetical protein
MSAHDLPLPVLLDEDQCSPPVERLNLAVFGHAGEGVVSVDDALYVVRTIETKRCGKEERAEPSGWGSGDRLLMQASS